MSKNINKILKDIKSIKIQGATNVAKASIGALLEFSKDFNKRKEFRVSAVESPVFLKEIEKIAKEFHDVRPDEPLNQNLLSFIVAKLKKDKSGDVKKKIVNLQKYCNEAIVLISRNEESIMANGVKLIKKIQRKKKRSINIFTHCHSSSAEKILIEAHKKKIPFKVYNSETRPRYQGKITAENLAKAGISVTMMVDDAVAFIFSKNDPDNIDIDLVIVGADVISKEGAILNKIGSYSLALAAKQAKIPFYTAASLLKLSHDFSSYHDIKIEKRDLTELWPSFAQSFVEGCRWHGKAMDGKQESFSHLKIINYAFDIVPPEYITGFITEFGIVKPKDVKKMVIKKYKKFFK